jgi:YVTN family beta-propeller protein
VGKHPLAIAVGGGSVWVGNSRDGTLSKIDPETNKVVEKLSIGNAPTGLAVGDGSLWVTVAADPLAAKPGVKATC